MNATADAFLRQVLGDEGIDGHWFYLWSVKGDQKTTHWFNTPRAVNWHHIGEDDTYFGVACAGKRGSSNQRIKADDASAIMGLWADIDWLDSNHKKEDLPETPEAALDLIKSFPVQPTFIVNSGHGYQCWWLFQEPWVFADESERLDAALLSRRWIETLRASAAARSYQLDGVHDLSRVMRLPGTFNLKDPESPVPVYIQYLGNTRYVVDDFERYLVDLPEETERKPVVLEGLESGLNPPLDKFNVLRANNTAFKATWDHRRTPKGDSSMSGIDLSLANFAVEAGWHDPEIYALLLAHRREYGESLKYRGYYERTIAKARVEQRAEAALRSSLKADNENSFENLSALLKFEIIAFEEMSGETPQYRIVLPDGRGLWIGTAETLVNQNRFRTRILEGVGVLMPRLKEPRWEAIVNGLMKMRTYRSTGAENTEAGRIEDWIRGYLRAVVPNTNGIADAVTSHAPFLHDDHLFIYSRTFLVWIRDTFGERLTSQELSAQLEVHNIHAETLWFQHARTHTRTSTNVRRLPKEQYPPEEYVTQ